MEGCPDKFLIFFYVFTLQVSGISSEIFKQIETVENDHDASTAAALEVSLGSPDLIKCP